MPAIARNTLFYGDDLPILRGYLDAESVDLIYLDPPFNSNRSYNVLFKDESGQESEAQIAGLEPGLSPPADPDRGRPAGRRRRAHAAGGDHLPPGRAGQAPGAGAKAAAVAACHMGKGTSKEEKAST